MVVGCLIKCGGIEYYELRSLFKFVIKMIEYKRLVITALEQHHHTVAGAYTACYLTTYNTLNKIFRLPSSFWG